VLFFIVSCGGGSSNSQKTSVTPIPKDPLAKYIDPIKSYKGNSTLAPVNPENIGIFFNYFFFIAEELLPSYSESPSEQNSGQLCASGGNATIADTDNTDEKKIVFSNCNDDGFIFDGNATIRITKYSSAGEVLDSLFIFEDTTLKSPFGDFTLIGTLADKTLSLNCPDNEIVYNFLLNDESTEQQILFDNFRFKRAGAGLSLCSDNGIFTSGKIYHSDIGYWEFGTTEIFRLRSMIPYADETGGLKIIGANKSSAQWSINSYVVNGQTKSFYKILLDNDGDGVFETNYKYLDDLIIDELLLSFIDNDNDGISDAWELMFDLDPFNDSDANLDSDDDGFSNFEEYSSFGNPVDSNILPWITDLAISLVQKSHSDRHKGVSVVEATLTNLGRVNAQNVQVVFDAQLPFTFSSNSGCEQNERTQILTCSYSKLAPEQDFTIEVLVDNQLESFESLEGKITGQVSALVDDPILENNTSELVYITPAVSIENVSVALGVRNTPTFSNHVIARDNEPFNISLVVDNHLNTEIENLNVRVNTPDFVVLEEVGCRQEYGGTWIDCQNENASDSSNNGYVMSKHSFRPTTTGKGQLVFEFFSTTTGETLLDTLSIPVISAKSTEFIQQQVDDAQHGQTIIVPSGIYTGSLISVNKKVIIESEFGANQTEFYGYNDNFSIGKIRLGNDSRISGFTIGNSPLTIEESGGQLNDNLFVSGENNFESTIINVYGALIFKRNTLIDDAYFINHDELLPQPSCTNFTFHRNVGEVKKIEMINNYYRQKFLLSGDQPRYCDFIEQQSGYELIVTNNTFIGGDKFLSLLLVGNVNRYIVDNITNNIFKDFHRASDFYLNEGTAEINISEFTVSHNFFDNTELFDDFQTMQFFEQIDNLEGDSWIQENGQPSENSPVIDAGLNNGLIDDNLGQERPIDGDNDSIQEVDIGAFEYQGN
jgi:hypothetical protein